MLKIIPKSEPRHICNGFRLGLSADDGRPFSASLQSLDHGTTVIYDASRLALSRSHLPYDTCVTDIGGYSPYATS